MKMICPDCNGRKIYQGLFTREFCYTCNGAGEIIKSDTSSNHVKNEIENEFNEEEDENIMVIGIVEDTPYIIDSYDSYEDCHARIETECGESWIIVKDYDTAEELVKEHFRDMFEDRSTCIEIIGTETLVTWGIGETDKFGNSSIDDWIELESTNSDPCDWLSSYGESHTIKTISGEWAKELGFVPMYAYRTD